jgi:hypothetical protein
MGTSYCGGMTATAAGSGEDVGRELLRLVIGLVSWAGTPAWSFVGRILYAIRVFDSASYLVLPGVFYVVCE